MRLNLKTSSPSPSSNSSSRSIGLTMAARTRHAIYQEGYWNKRAEVNKTNAEFMAYVERKIPSFVAGFFAKKAVIFTFSC